MYLYDRKVRVWGLCCSNGAHIVHIWGNQLVPQLLLKHSYTLHTESRHIEYLHEEVGCHTSTFKQNYSVLNLAIV